MISIFGYSYSYSYSYSLVIILFTVSYSHTHAAGLQTVHKMTDAWMTADLQRNADEICALLGYCGPYSGNFLCRHFGTSYLFRILEP